MTTNSDIYVTGCGPSLKTFDWSLLKDKTTIAVNGTLRLVPSPDYFITADSRMARLAVSNSFWNVSTCKVLVMADDHKRFKYVRPQLNRWDRRIVPRRFNGQISFIEEEFCTGQNSGFCGMQFAVILGAKTIHLLGMDFNVVGGKQCHSTYNTYVRSLEEFFVHFKTAIPILIDNGIEVINHSPTSRLNEIMSYTPMEK